MLARLRHHAETIVIERKSYRMNNPEGQGIRLTWNVLSIAHSPIPWPGNRIIPREDIDQLYCRQVISRGRRSGPSITYEVWLSTKSGGARKLLGAALDEQQALYVEQRIERALGLTDRAMAGEMER